MNKRSLNILLAVVFVVLSVALLSISSFFFYTSAVLTKGVEKKVLEEQCIKEFEVMGLKAKSIPHDHSILYHEGLAAPLQERVNASSIVIGRCGGYKLVEFCAGGGCPKPGISFVLRSL